MYPDRTPHTGLLEYKNVIRPVRAALVNRETGEIQLTNYRDFTNTEEFLTLSWEIQQDGDTVACGVMDDIKIAPHESGVITLPDAIPTAVSYTHLDVYKRQMSSSMRSGLTESNICTAALPSFAMAVSKPSFSIYNLKSSQICLLYTSRCV